MIDFWKLTEDFKSGDPVQKYMPPGQLSPFVGRVLAVHPGLGCLDVQWPFGVERVVSDEVVRVNPELMRFLPPTLDQSYSSYDTRKASGVTWRTIEVPAGFHRDLAALWHKGADEVTAYDTLWRKHAVLGAQDDAIKDEVARFYLAARNLGALRVDQHVVKTATYWVAQNRQYRVTQEELVSRKPNCPKCGTPMRRTTYKMDKGARIRLWACPKDLYLLKATAILGPDGQPVEW